MKVSENSRERAKVAAKMLAVYGDVNAPLSQAVTDALTDLLHYCTVCELPFYELLNVSKRHYREEVQP
jgi:hypothetical protein